MLYQIEFKKDQEVLYLHVNYPDGKLQGYLDSPAYASARKQMSIHKFSPTGNVYTSPSNVQVSQEIKNYLIKGSSLMENRILTEEVDVLVDQLERIDAIYKAKEKELLALLEEQPEKMLFGKVYGAMNVHTISTRPSYKKLFDKSKDLTKGIKEIFDQLIKAEENENKPHKSSERSLSTFAISKVAEKKAKVWKE